MNSGIDILEELDVTLYHLEMVSDKVYTFFGRQDHEILDAFEYHMQVIAHANRVLEKYRE